MRLLNLDLDVLYNEQSKQSMYDTEIELNLGSRLNDKLSNKVFIDSCVLVDLSNDVTDGYSLGGVKEPIINKGSVSYVNSNILFTSLYITQNKVPMIYDEVVVKGTKEDLSKIKIIAGGIAKNMEGIEVYNMVLKIPKSCYYGVKDDIRSKDELGVDTYNLKDLDVLSVKDIVDSCNIIPPRGVYNKTLYRHFKGKWYMVEGVGKWVDHEVVLVSYRGLYSDFELFYREKEIFTSENEKKEEYPLQDFRFMTMQELEYCLGEDSDEYKQILIEYNKLINEHPFIIGL